MADENLLVAQRKVKALTDAVRGLTVEARRLQMNLDRLHEFQASLLVVAQHWMGWLERSNQLQVTKGAHPFGLADAAETHFDNGK